MGGVASSVLGTPGPGFLAQSTPARTPGRSWSTPGRATPVSAGLVPQDGKPARGGASAALLSGGAPKSPVGVGVVHVELG